MWEKRQHTTLPAARGPLNPVTMPPSAEMGHRRDRYYRTYIRTNYERKKFGKCKNSY